MGTTASTSGITWKAKVTQIECYSLSRADPDCNQWITGVSGTVTSYNWPSIQLKSKAHNMCIRREAGYCGIQYQAYSATSPDSFALDDATITSVNGVAQAAITSNHGYLLIPGGPGASDVYSGGVFCDAIGLTCGGTSTNTAGSYGFKLAYVQLPCGAPIDYTTTDL